MSLAEPATPAIYTDRGGPFRAWGKEGSLGRFLEEELIDHHTTPAYRPQGRGKVEAVIHVGDFVAPFAAKMLALPSYALLTQEMSDV